MTGSKLCRDMYRMCYTGGLGKHLIRQNLFAVNSLIPLVAANSITGLW